MFKLKHIKEKLMTASAVLLSAAALNVQATATYDPASGIVDLPVVEVLSGGSSAFYSAQLQLVGDGLQLIAANPIAATTGQRNVFDSDTSSVHVASVTVGADSFYAKLKLVPGSNPMSFTIDQLVNNAFTGCPGFALPGPTANSCILSGTITTNVTLTKTFSGYSRDRSMWAVITPKALL